MTTKTHELGNGDFLATGYVFHDGIYTAMTRIDSRDFKTEKGAIAWLARWGYSADGKRSN